MDPTDVLPPHLSGVNITAPDEDAADSRPPTPGPAPSAAPDKGKRPRGRPPGSTNSPKAAPARSPSPGPRMQFSFDEPPLRFPTPKGKGKAPAKEEDDIVKEKVSLVRKIRAYQQAFPDVVTDQTPYTVAYDILVLQAAYFSIRADCSGAASEPMIRGAIYGLFPAAEKLTMKMGYNPFNLDLEGLGQLMEDPAARRHLEPEMTEMVIEMRHAVSMPWFVRLGCKMGYLVFHYSEARKIAAAASAFNMSAADKDVYLARARAARAEAATSQDE